MAGGGTYGGTAPEAPDIDGGVGCELAHPVGRTLPMVTAADGAMAIRTLTGVGDCAEYPYRYPALIGLAAHIGLPDIVITPGSSGIPHGTVPGARLLILTVGAAMVVTVTTGLTPLVVMPAGVGIATVLATLDPVVETPVESPMPGATELAAATGVFPVTG